MKKIKYLIIIFFFHYFTANANDDFEHWLKEFSNKAIKNGISKKTVDNVLYKAKFLPNVIKYDRYQPEFYEDTNTYITKRVNKKKIINFQKIYKKNIKLINKVENEFSVEKELLLALMGIETNYGNYLAMD